MIGHMALGLRTAVAGARIDAPLVQARLHLRTVGRDNALRPAGGRRAEEAGQTGADCMASVRHATLCVETARTRVARTGGHLRGSWSKQSTNHIKAMFVYIARVGYSATLTRNLNGTALGECIALHASGAAAHRHVREHLALGPLAAGARTWVHALVLHARFVARTVAIVAALRPAVAVRIAVIAGNAGALAGTAAIGVRAAR